MVEIWSRKYFQILKYSITVIVLLTEFGIFYSSLTPQTSIEVCAIYSIFYYLNFVWLLVHF